MRTVVQKFLTSHMTKILFLFILFLSTNCYGQKVFINPGVDTTDQQIVQAISVWTNYLNSKPDTLNMQTSPFWDETEKEKYPFVDQLYNSLGDTPPYEIGKPTILYAKPDSQFVLIKTLFSYSDSLQNTIAWCITNVYVKKENDTYKLYNALSKNISTWLMKKMGSVTYYYPPTYKFNETKAAKLILSINRLTEEWKLKKIPITYYIGETYEQLEKLRGLDYSAGMGNQTKPSGISDAKNKSVYCGGLGENYFHEVIHIYLNPLNPKSALREGVAVFYAGSMGQSLKWHLKRLSKYLAEHLEINLTNLEDFYYLDNFTNPNSTIQGLLCYLAYKEGGFEKLKKLLTYETLDAGIENGFGIKKKDFNHFLREQISLNKD